MGHKSTIEWTEATWNPITGCTLVSDGCRNCYAAMLAAGRLKNIKSRQGLSKLNAEGVAQFTGEVRFNEEWLLQPSSWHKSRKIFVCAHGDLFHEKAKVLWIDKIFAVMEANPRHTFQVLTKRPDIARDYLTARSVVRKWPLDHVWIGTSVEDQKTADERIPHLMDTPASVRFISAEPLLGPVSFDGIWGYSGSATGDQIDNWPIHWVIVGGETGMKSRPMHPDWARIIRDECLAAEVPFLFKQWGSWETVYDRDVEDPDWRRCPQTRDTDWNKERYLNLAGGCGFHGERVVYCKKTSLRSCGRLLDGKTWDQMPDA